MCHLIQKLSILLKLYSNVFVNFNVKLLLERPSQQLRYDESFEWIIHHTPHKNKGTYANPKWLVMAELRTRKHLQHLQLLLKIAKPPIGNFITIIQL
jgi:hypothetical protein